MQIKKNLKYLKMMLTENTLNFMPLILVFFIKLLMKKFSINEFGSSDFLFVVFLTYINIFIKEIKYCIHILEIHKRGNIEKLLIKHISVLIIIGALLSIEISFKSLENKTYDFYFIIMNILSFFLLLVNLILIKKEIEETRDFIEEFYAEQAKEYFKNEEEINELQKEIEESQEDWKSGLTEENLKKTKDLILKQGEIYKKNEIINTEGKKAKEKLEKFEKNNL